MVPVVAATTTHTQVISHGLTAFDWIKAGVIIAGGLVAAALLRRALRRRLHAEDFEARASLVAGRFAALAVSLIAFFIALGVVGIRLGPLIGAVGIGGIAVALAAQSMLADLIASILLQTRRPFHRGDQIATNDHEGRVEDVNFRTVVLRNYDGQRVFLPASKVLNGPIVNYTVLGRRRSHLAVGLSYDADLEEAAGVLLEAVRGVDGVHGRPAPEVMVKAFGDSAVTVELLFWHAPDQATTRRVGSAVVLASKRALDGAGIEIPFPQRVLYLNDVKADGPKPGGPKPGGPKPDGLRPVTGS